MFQKDGAKDSLCPSVANLVTKEKKQRITRILVIFVKVIKTLVTALR